jgi:hypothetical protein
LSLPFVRSINTKINSSPDARPQQQECHNDVSPTGSLAASDGTEYVIIVGVGINPNPSFLIRVHRIGDIFSDVVVVVVEFDIVP